MTGNGASKIYTKGGDKGKTSLIGGKRVSKSERRLHVYGTIDELNSVLGIFLADIAVDLAKQPTERDRLAREVRLIQRDLFDVGSQLACEDAKLRLSLPTISIDAIQNLEKSMDAFSRELAPLKNFILPGGSRSSSVAHLARTVCRRAERICVRLAETDAGEIDGLLIQFLNRLSDYLFVLARHVNRLLSVSEPIWEGKAKE